MLNLPAKLNGLLSHVLPAAAGQTWDIRLIGARLALDELDFQADGHIFANQHSAGFEG